MTRPDWKGAWAAIPTPMRDGRIDLKALRTFLHFLLNHHIDGIVACGTTGEAATLTAAEKESVIVTTLEETGGRVPVIAGVGTNDTRTTLENAEMARNLGVAGLLIVTPYYNKPNQECLYRHFSTIADKIDLPQLLYNVPSRTSCKLLVPTLARLSRHPNIVGTKDATGDMIFASETILECGPDFLMFSGDDGTTFPFLCLGGHGTISVVANVQPQWMHYICQLTAEGNIREAARIHGRMLPLFRALFSDTSPIPLKAILSCMDLGIHNELRSPLFAMEGQQLEELKMRVQSLLP